MPDVWLINGIPGAGKTTVARLLAGRFRRGVHIEGDALQGMIAGGDVWPGDEPADEAWSQILLNVRNQCLLARSYAGADFTPVIDYVVADKAMLLRFLHELNRLQVHFVTLAPGREVAVARGREREKDQRNLEAFGVTVAERWAHLEKGMSLELMGVGLWIDNALQTPAQTVDTVLQGREKARVGGL